MTFTLTPNCCLNPCFNGRYSQSVVDLPAPQAGVCLNPCFNGRYCQSSKRIIFGVMVCVLILVLMEDTLRDAIKDIIGAAISRS